MNCWAIAIETSNAIDRSGCCALCVATTRDVLRCGYADVPQWDADDDEDGGSMRSETCSASGANDDDGGGGDDSGTTEAVETPSPTSESFAFSSRESCHNCCCC